MVIFARKISATASARDSFVILRIRIIGGVLFLIVSGAIMHAVACVKLSIIGAFRPAIFTDHNLSFLRCKRGSAHG